MKDKIILIFSVIIIAAVIVVTIVFGNQYKQPKNVVSAATTQAVDSGAYPSEEDLQTVEETETPQTVETVTETTPEQQVVEQPAEQPTNE